MSRAADGSVTVHLPNNWLTAVGVGAFAAFVYAALVLIYTLVAPEVSITTSPLDALGISWLFCLGTVGVPVSLWFRYDFRWPLALMGFVLLVSIGLTGWQTLERGGDSPAVALTIFFAPIYVVVYAVVAYAESGRWRRLLRS